MTQPLPKLRHRDTKEPIDPARVQNVQAAADGGLVAWIAPLDTTDATAGRWVPVEVDMDSAGIPAELLQTARDIMARVNGQLDKGAPATPEERAIFLQEADHFRDSAFAGLSKAIDMFHELPLAMREDLKAVLRPVLELLVLSAAALASSGELLKQRRLKPTPPPQKAAELEDDESDD